MSTQGITFHGIETDVAPPVQLRPFVRFPFVKEAAVGHLAKAIDFEKHAGRAVLHGELAEAEHLRAQARSAWTKYREAFADDHPHPRLRRTDFISLPLRRRPLLSGRVRGN